MSTRTSTRTADARDPRTDPVIELRGVHVIHRSRTGGLLRPDTVHAVDDVSLTVRRGQTLGLVGESGCGKSTTARVMVGLQAPTRGEVRFKGRRLGRSAAERRELGRSVSVVFQDPATALNPRMIVHDALIDPLNVHGIGSAAQREARVRELLHLVGLPPSALGVLPRQISGGQRQRVAIARALANDPSVLLCDEATSALDPKTTGGILDLLGRLNAQTGLTVVLITHEMGVVKQICSHVAVMEEGRIIERGSTVDVFTDPHEPLTRDFIDTANHVEAGITTVITHPDLVRHGSGDRLVSLQFAGATTGDPVVAALTRDYNVNATILFANVEVISGTPVGNLLLGLSGSQPDLDAAEGWLAGSGVRVHNYSDAEIESIRERAAAEAADVDGGRDEEDHR